MLQRSADTPISAPLRWVGFRQAALRQGSHAQAQGFELAVTPLVFGAIGYGLDRWLGLLPALTIAFAVFGFVGVAARMWFRYDAQMRDEQAALVARRAEVVAAEDAARAETAAQIEQDRLQAEQLLADVALRRLPEAVASAHDRADGRAS